MDSLSELHLLQDENKKLRTLISATRDERNDTTLLKAASAIDNLPRLALKQRRVLRGHLSKISSLHWAADGRRLVSASQDGKLIVWNAFTSNKLHLITLRVPWIITCAFAPGGKMIACGGLDNKCSVYSLGDKASAPRHELTGHEGYVSCCRFSDDRHVITSSGDMTCVLWDTEQGQFVSSFADHKNDVMCVDPCPSNPSLFASGGCDAQTKIWDVRTGKCVHTFSGHKLDVNTVMWFPNGQAVGTGSDDASCRLFDLRADRELMQLTHDKLQCGVTSIAFSVSGRFLFAAYEEYNCIIWDVMKGRRLSVFTGHESRVSSLGMSPDGMALATGSWDSFIKIWA